jgi:hypothetical protein
MYVRFSAPQTGSVVHNSRCDLTHFLHRPDVGSDCWPSSFGDLFERIRKTMPMNKPGSVPRDAIPDILAYILIVNKFPVGETELSRDARLLNKIQIEATKPDQKNQQNHQER